MRALRTAVSGWPACERQPGASIVLGQTLMSFDVSLSRWQRTRSDQAATLTGFAGQNWRTRR